MNKRHHQYELDILRIIGAITIVLFHYSFRGYAADNMSIVHFPLIGSNFKYGYLGIYLFFTLAGYTTILSASNKNFTTFICGRIVRLYPSFWVAVSLTALVTIFLGGGRYHVEPLQFFANLTMLSSYIGVKSVDGVYWFIFVLLRFYFLIAMLILFKIIKFQKYIIGIWLTVSIAIAIFHIPKIGLFLIPQYAPFLISGMIFYSAKEEGWDSYKALIILISFSFSLYQILQAIPNFNEYYNVELSFLIVSLFILFIYIFMFFVSINNYQIKLHSSVIVLGACSYPLYLIHHNIGFMLFNYFGDRVNKYILLIFILSLMYFFSILIIKYVEPYIAIVLKKLMRIQNHPSNRSAGSYRES